MNEPQQTEVRKQFRRDPRVQQKPPSRSQTTDSKFRRDPQFRLADGAVFPEIENGHPDMTYKLVFQSTNNEDVRQHEQQGWQVVLSHPDGPRLIDGIGASCKEGEPIEWHGHVLMDINRQDVERVYNAGQKRMDTIEKRIVDKDRGPFDAARGMRNRFGFAVNETKPNERGFVAAEEQEIDG